MMLVTNANKNFMFWFMCGLQYLNTASMYVLLAQMDWIRTQLVPSRYNAAKAAVPPKGGKSKEMKTYNTMKDKKGSPPEAGPESRPTPLYLDQSPITRRSNPLSTWFLGDVPNLHEQLFWFDRCGPSFIQDYTRGNLLYLAIYVPIVGTQISIMLADTSSGENPMWWIVVRICLALLPWAVSFKEILNLASRQDIINIEMMRKKEIIDKVKADQLGRRVISLFKVLNKLRMNANIEMDAETMANPAAAGVNMDEIDLSWRADVEDTFNSYDVDGSGDLDESEILRFLHSLGEDADIDKATALCKALDVSGNSKVSCDEFVGWLYVQKERNNDGKAQTIEEVAHNIFHLFDDNDSGTVTREEMEGTLATHGIHLSYDEMSILMKELDPNGDGHVTLSEFTNMLERYDFQA